MLLQACVVVFFKLFMLFLGVFVWVFIYVFANRRIFVAKWYFMWVEILFRCIFFWVSFESYNSWTCYNIQTKELGRAYLFFYLLFINPKWTICRTRARSNDIRKSPSERNTIKNVVIHRSILSESVMHER